MGRRRRKRSKLPSLLLLAILLGAAWYAERHGCLPEPEHDGYVREAWPHWIDEDGDCQDTRSEVLIAESLVPVTFAKGARCKVIRGRWLCPYTGKTINDPHVMDIDHLVPLHEAHRSGGDDWDQSRRRRYANALADDAHLVAVERGSNRSKGDKDPSQWMPVSPGFRCEYLRAWQRVKLRWELSMDADETRYVERSLEVCARGGTPDLPDAQRG